MNLTPALGLSLFTLVACGVDAPAWIDNEELASPPPGLLQACSGDYTCTTPTLSLSGSDPSRTVTLSRASDGGCNVDKLELLSDGTVRGADTGTTWTGDSAQFSICLNGTCATCAPPKPKTQCSGLATPCGQRPLSRCEDVSWCSLKYVDPRSLTNSDQYCAGTPDDCSVYSGDANTCKAAGCDWN